MTRCSLVLLFILITLSIQAQTGRSIIIGHTDSLFSKTLKEERKLWISVPENSGNNTRYPVLYLLDGDDHFHSVTGIISHLGESRSNAVIPDMIVVAILNTNRTRDLTPTAAPEHKGSGRAEAFTTFIEKELIPYIDGHYPTVGHRVLAGHSFAGLFVMNTLMHHPGLFNSYLALDPSVWWDNMQPLKQIEANIEKQKFDNRKLFLGFSDQGDTVFARKDTSNATIATRAHLRLLDVLKYTNNKSLRFSYKFFPEDTHGTLPLPGTYEGIRSIFDFYKRPSFGRLGEPSFNADSILSAHYTNVSRQMGYTILPSESLINGLAWLCSMRNMPDKELAYYKMNITNYPNSFDAYCMLGRYYENHNNKKTAIEYYTKALTIQDDPELKKHIDNLRSSK